MSTTIESLEIEVQQNSTSAVNGIEALSSSLSRLKSAVKGGVGLTAVAKQLTTLNIALNSVNGANADTLNKLAQSLQTLSSCGNLKLSSSIATQIMNIGTAIKSLSGTDFSVMSSMTNALTPLTNIGKSNLNSFISQLQRLPQAVQALSSVDMGAVGTQIQQLISAFAPLSQMGKNNLTSFLTQLQKIPQAMRDLRSVDMGELTSQIQQLANAFAPLATRMQSIANGFAAFPARIQRLITSTNRLTTANNRASTSYVNFAAKIGIAYVALKRIARVVASWIVESNKYVEDMNLFTVSMGEYAQEAQSYAEKVSEVLGIDPAAWMRDQGIFNTIIKGFGVASDKAQLMSKNLTQLGYDISSFYNISIEDAMTKLSSGIAGELEPLRRLGYDLSVARLQQEALNLGIKKSVQNMTQAEKSQLRYYAIMTQVTDAQGDMARTLNAPANQLRILQAQLTQCARALGNIFIPALNAVLPYAIALAKVIKLLADTIASLFGYTPTTIDYSSLDTGTSVAEELGDAFEDTNEEAKKLKKTIMGFDELNLLNDNSDDSSALDSLGDSFNIGLPEYDFLNDAVSNRVDEIVQKMKEWLGLTEEINSWADLLNTRFGKILVAVGAIAAGLLAWKVTKGLLDAIEAINALRKAGMIPVVLGISLLVTGLALEWAGIMDAIKNQLGKGNFAKIITGGLLSVGVGVLLGKAIAGWITKAFAESAVAKALVTAAENLALGSATAAGAALGAAVMAIIAGIPMFFTGIWDAIKNGLNWLNGILIPTGSTLAGAGIGAIIGACSGPIGAGIGALIGLAVGLITDGIIAIVENWDSINAWFVDKWEGLKNWWTNSLMPFFQGIPAWFGGIFESVKTWIVEKWTSITDFMGNLPEKIGGIITAIGNWFAELPGKIGYGLGYALGSVVKWATDVWTTLSTEVPKIVEAVGTWFKELPGKVWNAISTTASKIAQWASETWNAFKTKVGEIVTAVGTWFSALPGKIYSAISRAVAKVAQWGSDMIAKIKQVVPEIINKIVNFFKELPDKLCKLGSDIWNGLVNGLKNAWKTVTGAISDFVGGFVNGFKNALGIHSPSTVFQSIGGNIVAGLSNGMSGIGKTFQSVFSTVGGWIGSFGKNMYSWGSDMMSNMVTGINSGLSSLASKVRSAANTIRSFLHFSQPDVGPLADFNSWMPDMMSQLASGIADNEAQVKKQVAKLAGDMSLESSIQANVSAYGAKPATSSVSDADSGLASALYNAVSSAIAGKGDGEESGTPIIINLGNEQIASFLVKQNKRVALISGGRA